MGCVTIKSLSMGLIFLMSFLPQNLNAWSETTDNITLPYIALSEDSELWNIMKEAELETNRYKNYGLTFYSLDIKNTSDGVMASVVSHSKARLGKYDGYTGYSMLDSVPIIITNKSSLKLKIDRKNTMTFAMDSPNTPPYVYDPLELLFKVSKNNYARYVFGIGWIWSRPVKTVSPSNPFYPVYAPKRTLK